MRTLLVLLIGTHFLSTCSAEEKLECPKISDGNYPLCKCKHGPAYDIGTNTCPNPECPENESIGIYPNCTCQQKNFDYSITFNECFRVCPENSTGYWPKCNCDVDGYVFNKKLFKCIACPADSTGQYPDCKCESDGDIYNIFDNICKESKPCPFRSNGKYPNCTCEGNGIYNELTNICKDCPRGSTGVYPDCNCENGSTYNETSNFCSQCPVESVGVHPDCVCLDQNSTYVWNSNSCYTCPANSTGQYPNCDCEYPLQYVQNENLCVGCPEEISGIFPHCKCDNGYFSKTLRRCIECPANTTGLYPACKCEEENLLFSAFLNQCYPKCPENSHGARPGCVCDDGYYYDDSEFACKSEIGRMCPADSIGTGPDCLCVRKNHLFYSSHWICLPEGVAVQLGSPVFCPRSSGKWPQCEALIDFKVVTSALG